MFSKLASSKLAPSMVKRNLARTRPARFPLATVLGSIGVLACGQIYEDPTPGSGGTSGGTGGKTGVTLTGGAGGGSSGSGGSGGAGRGGTAGTTGITLVTGGSSSGGRTSAGGAAGQGAAPSGGSAGKGGAGGAGGTTVAGGSIGWAGAGGDWGDVGDYVALRESSWNVRLAMNVAPVSTYPVSCPKAEFTLHVKPVGDTLEVISGRNGSVMTGQLLRTPRLETTYGLGDQLGFPTRGECTFSTIGIKEIALWGWDENADGQADSIAGEGKAQAMFIMGDVGITVQMTFRLTGNPDTAPPTILPPSELHPLDGVMLTASEPLSLKSGAGLNSETGAARVPLTANVTDDAAIGSFSSAKILDFGSRWRVTANGSDLAGLPFDQALTPSAVVLSDPGVFAQDGFEGPFKGLLDGGAKVASNVGSLGAISGMQSLFVPPTGSVTLHLSRPAAATALRYSVQTLTNVSGYSAGAPILEAGVIGGSKRVRSEPITSASAGSSTGDSSWGFAGPKQEVSLSLPDVGSDVVIRLTPSSCMGLCPPPQALWIDDLRVE